jgi:transcriptional regulator with XRE-family HTH domain
MGERLGVSDRTIYNYEKPYGRLPFNRLEEWAQITGVTREWLLDGGNVPTLGDARLAAIEDELQRVNLELQTLAALVPAIERLDAAAARVLALLARVEGASAGRESSREDR